MGFPVGRSGGMGADADFCGEISHCVSGFFLPPLDLIRDRP